MNDDHSSEPTKDDIGFFHARLVEIHRDLDILQSDSTLAPEADALIQNALLHLGHAQTLAVQMKDSAIAFTWAQPTLGDLESIHVHLAEVGFRLYDVRDYIDQKSDGAKLVRNALEACDSVHSRIVEIFPGIGTE